MRSAAVATPLARADEDRRAYAGTVRVSTDRPAARDRLPQQLRVGQRRDLDLLAVAAVHRRTGQAVQEALAGEVVLGEQGGEAGGHGHPPTVVRVGGRRNRIQDRPRAASVSGARVTGLSGAATAWPSVTRVEALVEVDRGRQPVLLPVLRVVQQDHVLAADHGLDPRPR